MATKEVIFTDKVPAPGSFSQAIRHGGTVYLSGSVGIDPATGEYAEGLTAQVRQALKNMTALLEASGSSVEDVLKVTCYLSDIKAFREFDQVFGETFSAPFPARVTLGAMLPGKIMFEIDVIAAVKES